MTKDEAQAICTKHVIPVGQNFHALGSETVERILAAADEWKYRKPRNANGSRARYFYYFLSRVMRRETHEV